MAMPETRFTVRGSWPFPYDMLRYDLCYPAEENDSHTLLRLCNHRTEAGNVEVNLASVSNASPTRARWERFMWRVIPIAVFMASVSVVASAQTITKNCYRYTHGITCTTRVLPNMSADPRVIRIPQLEYSAEDRAARDEREAKWVEFCAPRIVTGADGIGRYVYAKPGCENGRTE